MRIDTDIQYYTLISIVRESIMSNILHLQLYQYNRWVDKKKLCAYMYVCKCMLWNTHRDIETMQWYGMVWY